MNQHPDSRASGLSFFRNRKLHLLGISALVLTYLVLPMGSSSRATAPANAPAPAPAAVASTARLIYDGRFWKGTIDGVLIDSPVPTPLWVSNSNNLAFMESQPFDGLVIYLRVIDGLNVSTATMTGTALTESQVLSVLQPLDDLPFVNLQHNMGLILATSETTQPPGLFNDDGWRTVADNFGHVAKAAKAVGLKGLVFDNENYFTANWSDWPTGSTPDLITVQKQAQKRGYEVMKAILEYFPDIVFLTLHGPYISTDKAPANLKFHNWSHANEVLGPFFVGHLEAVRERGTTARVIDGGQLYDLRTGPDFVNSGNWRRKDLGMPDTGFIPPELDEEVWEEMASISFGVLDKPPPWEPFTPMDSDIMRTTLANALKAADHYVWLYSEARTFLRPPGPAANQRGADAAWVNAVRNARTDAGVGAGQGPLAAPADLRGYPASTTVVHLQWDDMSTAETGFHVERKDGETWPQIATLEAGAQSYSNTGLSAGTTYTYRVRAYNGTGNSPYSNEFTVATPASSGIPAAPTNLAVVSVTTSTVALSWTDNSSNENGFIIEILSGGTWSEAGLVPANTTTFTKTGLSAITSYSFRVLAQNGSGNSTTSNQVTATTLAPSLVPMAPTGLVANSVTSSTVTMSWTDESYDEDGFSIELLDEGTWSQTGTVSQGATTFTKSALEANTAYTFRVRAFNGQGSSAPTNQVTATTSASSESPAAPSNLAVTAVSEMTVAISWTDNSSNENGFSIERLNDGAWSQYDWRSANVTTFIAGGLSPNTAYTFRVRAFNGSGSSAPTNEITGTTSASSGAPTAPTNLTVNSVTETTITISWTDNSSNESVFIIERQIDGTWSQYDWRSANITTFTTGGLAPNTARTFRVVAFNASGNSAPSNTVSATTSGSSGLPTAPSNLTVQSVTSTSVTLSWTDNSSNENGFSIERLKAGGVWSQTGWVPANTTTFTKAGLSASTAYSFRVLAFNGTGNSSTTNTVSATTSAPPSPPAAPTNLVLTYATSSTLTVSWTDGSDNENGFSIEKLVSGSWTQTGSVSANATTFTKSGLPAGTWFDYRVVAFNGGGNSGPSNVLHAQTSPSGSPAAPTNLTVASVTSSSVALSWLDNSTNENGFNVEKLVGGTWTFVATVVTGSNYTVPNLSPNTTYSFRVYAFNGPGNSWYTNVATTTTSN
jgi:hypothetical protein